MASARASRRVLAAVALTVAGLAACQRGAGPRQAAVVAKSVEDVFLLSGELRAVDSSTVVTPRGDSLQLRWLAEDGAEVRVGDPVAELDPTAAIQRLEERRLRLRQAELQREGLLLASAAEQDRRRAAVEAAEIEDEKARLEASVPLEYREPRSRPQLQAKWLQTKAALERARLERDAQATTARAEIAAALAAEHKARRELEQVEASLAGMSLRAPRDGVFQVAANPWQFGPDGPPKLQPGDRVNAGFAVGTIPDPARLEVEARLPEADHGRIAEGMSARCILDTYPDRVHWGRVEAIAAVASEASRNTRSAPAGFAVRLSLVRSEPLMRPGLSVRVEVLRRHWPRALVVPRAAVRFGRRGPLAVRGGRELELRLAACTPLDCVVEAGLSEGDRVLLF